MAIVFSRDSVMRTERSWQLFDEVNGAPNKGARLAVDLANEKATFLFVDIDAQGSIAMHSQPERSVCFIVEGDGWIVVEGQSNFAYAKGDMIMFDPDVLHGWRGNNAKTRILVGLLS
jgi:quercetin dioxygenase-like cupin family protein